MYCCSMLWQQLFAIGDIKQVWVNRLGGKSFNFGAHRISDTLPVSMPCEFRVNPLTKTLVWYHVSWYLNLIFGKHTWNTNSMYVWNGLLHSSIGWLHMTISRSPCSQQHEPRRHATFRLVIGCCMRSSTICLIKESTQVQRYVLRQSENLWPIYPPYARGYLPAGDCPPN